MDENDFFAELDRIDSGEFSGSDALASSLGIGMEETPSASSSFGVDFIRNTGNVIGGAFSGIANNVSNIFVPQFDREEWKAESAFNAHEAEREKWIEEGRTDEFFQKRNELIEDIRKSQSQGFDWKSYNPTNPLSFFTSFGLVQDMVRNRQEHVQDNRDYFREDLGPVASGISSGLESMAGMMAGPGVMPVYIYGMTRAQYEEQLVELEEQGKLNDEVYARATKNAFLSGATEFASQYFTLGVFKAVGAPVSALTRGVGGKVAGDIVKRAGLQSIIRTALGFIPEYVEESITEGIQGALEMDTRRFADGDEDSSLSLLDAYNETAKFYDLERPEDIITLASSVILMQGVGGAVYSRQNHENELKEIMAQGIEEKIVEGGIERKEARKRAQEWKASPRSNAFLNEAERQAFKESIGTDNMTQEQIQAKGVNPMDLWLMRQDLRDQVVEELLTGETSPSYERWKRLYGEDSSFASRVKADARSPITLELAPDSYTDKIRGAGYQGSQTDIDISYPITHAVYKNSVQSGEMDFDTWLDRKMEADKKSKILLRDPESLERQARTTFFPEGVSEIVQPPERLAQTYFDNLPKQMEKAKNLKEAIGIFKGEMQEYFPELVEILDDLQGPALNKAMIRKKFFADVQEIADHYGSVDTKSDGTVKSLHVSPDLFAKDIAKFAENFVHEVLHVATSHSFERIKKTPEISNFFKRQGKLYQTLFKYQSDEVKKELMKLKQENSTRQEEFISEFISNSSFQERVLENVPMEVRQELFESLATELLPILNRMDSTANQDPLVALTLANVIGLTQTEGVLFQRATELRQQIRDFETDLNSRESSEGDKQRLALMKEQLAQMEKAPPRIVQGELFPGMGTLYQARGFHGSGAKFSQPSKAFRLSGEGTMYEGAGFYMTHGEEKTGKGNPKGRAKWYAETYATDTPLFRKIKNILNKSIDLTFAAENPWNEIINAFSYSANLDTGERTTWFDRDKLTRRLELFGYKKETIEEVLSLIPEDVKESDFQTRALYEVNAFEGMERVGEPERLSTEEISEIEGEVFETIWESDVTDERVLDILNPFRSIVSYDVEQELKGLDKEALLPKFKESIREHFKQVKDGVSSTYLLPDTFDLTYQAAGIIQLAVQALHAEFEEEYNANVKAIIEQSEAKASFDFSDSDSGWIFKDLNQYYLLPWNERVPYSILQEIEKRLPGKVELNPTHVNDFFELGITGRVLYRKLQEKYFNDSDHATSEFLDSIGITGTIYNGVGGENIVVYDEKNVKVGEPELFQEANAKVLLGPAGNFDLTFFESANISSIFHEFSHIFLQNMSTRTQRKFAKLYGMKQVPEFNGPGWEQLHEQFARDFEQYILEGVSPTYELREVMYSASESMLSAYQGFKKVPGSNLKPNVQKAMDNIISTRKQRLELQVRLNIDSPDQWEYEKNVEEYKMKYMFGEILKEYQEQNRPYEEFVDDMMQRLQSKNSEDFPMQALNSVPETVISQWRDKLMEGDYSNVKKVYGELRNTYMRERRAAALSKFRETQKRLKKERRTIVNEDVKKMIDFVMEGLDVKLSAKDARESLRKAKREISSFENPFQAFESLLETRGRAITELSTEELISIERELTGLLNFESARLMDRKLSQYKDMAELMDAARNQLSQIAQERELKGRFSFFNRTDRRKRWPQGQVIAQMKPETIIDTIIRAEPGTPIYEIFYGAVDRGASKEMDYIDQGEQILAKLAGAFFDQASDFSRGTSPTELMMEKIAGPREREIEFEFTHPDNPEMFKKVGLTRAEIISIAMLAYDHNGRRSLLEGGMILGDKAVTRKAIRMTEQDLDNILNSLGEDEGYVMSVLKEYYEFEYKHRADTFYKMNGLQLERSGEIYFPRDVDRGQKAEERATNEKFYTNSFLNQYNRNLENQSFLHGRKTHRRPLIVRDAFVRTVESMQQTGKYVGLAEPYRNFRAAMFDAEHEVSVDQPGVVDGRGATFVRAGKETIRKDGIMNQIKEYFGPEVYQGILSYYEAVFEGQDPLTGTDAFFEAMRQRAVVSILGLNARVAVKQASSAAFYAPYTDSNILSQAIASPWGIERMSEVSPQMKERFKIGGGHRDLAENYKQHHTRTLLMGGPKVSRGEFVRGFSMIRKMDAIAMGMAFRIAELEGLRGDELVDRAEWLARHTQPNFHVKDRSSLQRQKGPLARLVTSFGSFTTMITNQMAYQGSNGTPASRAKFIAAIVANSAIVAGVDTAFDYLFGMGDEDEEPVEELIGNFWEALQRTTIGAPFIVGDIIDIISAEDGFFFNNPTDLLFRPIESATRAVRGLAEDPNGEDLQTLAESIAALLGIPLKNAMDWIMLPATIGEED